MSVPVCACHGEPKQWHRDKRRPSGGGWRCATARRDARRRYRHTNPDLVRQTNARRIFTAGMYLGSFGFTTTEREEMIHGKAD